MAFSSQALELPAACYSKTKPAGASAPRLIAFNDVLGNELGIEAESPDHEQKLNVFSGNTIAPGSVPVSLAYAGHQFGHFSPQLGDGRAVLLGELSDDKGRRFEVQLKGSGRTAFSRGGDGKSALGPVIREYILSEAMHALGVPTTRALAAVATGDKVLRETPLPGGILTRVAASHLRIGTLQFFAARGATDILEALVDYAIHRHYPDIADAESRPLALFDAVAGAQARLVAHWMSLGFIHGVMNTDNMTLSGETIDYGPAAFMDEYRAEQVYSAIDRGGRYAFDQQPRVLQWNLARLAECLLMLDDRQTLFEEVLEDVPRRYLISYQQRMRSRLGLLDEQDDDDALICDWLEYLEQSSLDYHTSFVQLVEWLDQDNVPDGPPVLTKWYERVTRQSASRQQVISAMSAANPLYIPRNHLVERAIAAAYADDLEPFETMNRVLASPFTAQAGMDLFRQPPRPEERVTRTFCGT